MLAKAWSRVGRWAFGNRSFQGSWHDRIAGLFDLDVDYAGAAVLDIGCNMGIVGYEVCKRGVTSYHGIEKMAVHHFVAESIFEGVDVDWKVDRIDIASAQSRNAYLNDNYDVVLYLAVHQHLKRQVGQAAATETLQDLLNRCTGHFVFRGPDIEEVIEVAESLGFEKGSSVPRGTLNPMCVLLRA